MVQFVFVFFAIALLVFIHEFFHFIFAKKFKIKVEELGLGYPPALLKKKIGSTTYSLNLLPFGGFLKIDDNEFKKAKLSHRAWVILGGVISFWILAFLLLTFLAFSGMPQVVGDDEIFENLNAKILILSLSENSPAFLAGLKAGDKILAIKSPDQKIEKNLNIKKLQQLTKEFSGQTISLIVERGEKIFEISVVPRKNPPLGEGPLGVSLQRIIIKKTPIYLAPWEGIKATFNLTSNLILNYFDFFKKLILGSQVNSQLVGPVGVFHLSLSVFQLGLNYFLAFLAQVMISLAIINLLPLPALDGGKLLFLGIEALRKEALNEEFEKAINLLFFGILVLLMIFVTVKDIQRIF